MKNLRKDIKNILKNECLTNVEKDHLKKILEKFINTRNILTRKHIDFDFEEDQCFGLDDILNRN